ncbi:hypothetical protein ACTXT7_015687 [Hymenolepis weldensis]
MLNSVKEQCFQILLCGIENVCDRKAKILLQSTITMSLPPQQNRRSRHDEINGCSSIGPMPDQSYFATLNKLRKSSLANHNPITYV